MNFFTGILFFSLSSNKFVEMNKNCREWKKKDSFFLKITTEWNSPWENILEELEKLFITDDTQLTREVLNK